MNRVSNGYKSQKLYHVLEGVGISTITSVIKIEQQRM